MFSAKAAMEQRDEIHSVLTAWDVCDLVDIDGINLEGLLFDECDLAAVITRLKNSQVDGGFFPHCNFGCEHLVGSPRLFLDNDLQRRRTA